MAAEVCCCRFSGLGEDTLVRDRHSAICLWFFSGLFGPPTDIISTLSPRLQSGNQACSFPIITTTANRMGEKRDRPHHFNDSRQLQKRQKGDRSHVRPSHHVKSRGNLGDVLSGLPEPESCQPCQSANSDMLSGTIALLDQLVADEAGAKADKHVLHHARELHRLLSLRAAQSLPSKAMQSLDSNRPETAPKVRIPPALVSRVKKAKGLPSLPPITEPYLQDAVFTHTSANDYSTANVRGYRSDHLNYERLEFLGDAFIEVIASRLLYSRFPDTETSHQSALRESLVKNETLSRFSEAYGLGDRLKHGTHVRNSKNWPKILADVFEAYVAAVVLSDPESGYGVAESWLTELWAPKLLEFKLKPIENPKARDELSKLLMAKGIKLDYRQERPMEVTAGQQKFFIGVYLTGWGFENEWLGSGEGQNKSQACVFAAMDALKNRRPIIAVANARKLEVYPPKAEDSVINGTKSTGRGNLENS